MGGGRNFHDSGNDDCACRDDNFDYGGRNGRDHDHNDRSSDDCRGDRGRSNAAAAARQPAAPTPPAVVPTQPALPGQPTQTQPAPPVTAAAETAKAGNGLYTLTVTGDGGIAEVRGGGAYRAGDMVTVEATTLLGYTFRQWASSDPSVLPGINLKTYTFQMPAQNIHLNAVSYNKPKVTVVAGNGVLSVSGGGNYEIGQTVTVSAQLEPGYTFVAWTADVAGFGSPAQTYTFKMPEKPITLTATAVKK